MKAENIVNEPSETKKKGRPKGSTKKTTEEDTFKKYTFNLDNGLREQLELIGERDCRTLASVMERAIMTYIALHDANGDEVYNIKQILQQGILDGVPVMPHSARSMAFPQGKPAAAAAAPETIEPVQVENVTQSNTNTDTEETSETIKTPTTDNTETPGAVRRGARKNVVSI